MKKEEWQLYQLVPLCDNFGLITESTLSVPKYDWIKISPPKALFLNSWKNVNNS